jgi:hypothetical protein
MRTCVRVCDYTSPAVLNPGSRCTAPLGLFAQAVKTKLSAALASRPADVSALRVQLLGRGAA